METIKSNIRLKDYIKDIDDKAERRYNIAVLSFKEIETNGAKSQDENVISGYAAVFNKDSEDFGGWIERISPGAFTQCMDDDCVALFNHSMNLVLGRNKVNVQLEQDGVGLKYTVKLLDTNLSNDIRALVKGGVINKSSFAFTVEEETFTKGDPTKGVPHVRTITKIERLYDVSPVTMPAYPDTSVASRSMTKNIAIEDIQKALSEQQLRISHRYLKHKFNFKTRFK
jgi:HK97 family phage prohead protease